MNDTLKCIFNRYSCRDFTDKMPSNEEIDLMAKAAVAAPSAMDRQPWRVVIVKNKSLMDEMEQEGIRALSEMEDKSAYNRIMSRGGTLFYHAPLMIVIPTAPNSGLDCGIVTQNIAIAAESLGINSLICGLAGLCFSKEKADKFKTKLMFPQDYNFGMAVLLGYVKQGSGEKPPHEPDMSKIITVE